MVSAAPRAHDRRGASSRRRQERGRGEEIAGVGRFEWCETHESTFDHLCALSPRSPTAFFSGRCIVRPRERPTGTRHEVAMRTHCPFCALGCAMRLESTPTGYRARGDAEFDVNAGDLCTKGFASAETLDDPGNVGRSARCGGAGFSRRARVARAGCGRRFRKRGADERGRVCVREIRAVGARWRSRPTVSSYLARRSRYALGRGREPARNDAPLERYLVRQRARGISIVVDPRVTGTGYGTCRADLASIVMAAGATPSASKTSPQDRT